nr:radical SAM protein [Candidatus Sigynarchaeota archaeon]
MKLHGSCTERFKALGLGDAARYDAMVKALNQPMVPKTCQVLMNFGCNQRCVHCFLGQAESRGVASIDVMTSAIEKLLARGNNIYAYPTEPLMSEASLSAYTRFHDPDGGFITNGTAPLASDPAKLVTMLAERGVRNVYVSLHGATEATHEALTRVPGSFKRAMATIEAIGALDRRGKMTVSLESTIHRENVAELEGIVDIAAKHGIRHVFLLRLVPVNHGNIPPNMLMNRQAVVDALAATRKAREKYEGDVYVELGISWGPNFNSHRIWEFLALNVRMGNTRHFCFAGSRWIAVDPGKNVLYPCMASSGAPELVAGEFVPGTGELRYNEFGNQLLRWHADWNEKAKGCCSPSECPYSMICHGGCRSTAVAETLTRGDGVDWFAPFPYCQTQLTNELL